MRRHITAAIKRKASELQRAHTKRLCVQQQKFHSLINKTQTRKTRQAASLKCKLTNITNKFDKRDSTQRGLLTKLQNRLVAERRQHESTLQENKELLQALKTEKSRRAHDRASHHKAMLEEMKQHRHEVNKIRELSRQNQDKVATARDQSHRDTEKIQELQSLSESLQQMYDELRVQFSKGILGPLAADHRKLQKKIAKLASREQTWIEKVKHRRSIYKSVQSRIKLLHTKQKLNNMIDQLREKLKRERDQGIMCKLRAALKEKDSENADLENTVEMLREELRERDATVGPAWLRKMPLKDSAKQAPYPNELVADAMVRMSV